MTERALSLTAPLALAFKQGRKDVTRRPVRPAPAWSTGSRERADGWYVRGRSKYVALEGWADTSDFAAQLVSHIGCPFGRTGDTFWIREPARVLDVGQSNGGRVVRLRYVSDGVESDWLSYPERLATPVVGKGIPNGVHREGARLFAELVSVGAETVQAITEADAIREGCLGGHGSIPGYDFSATPLEHFKHIWTAIYGAKSWESGWCWRLELRRLEKDSRHG